MTKDDTAKFVAKIAREIINEVLTENDELLTESVKTGVKFKFGSREMDFGSAEHVKVLRAMLHSLQSLRDCYNTGSANRHVFAMACHKLKRLIDKHGTSPSP